MRNKNVLYKTYLILVFSLIGVRSYSQTPYEIERVGPEGAHSIFGYYNTSPESPDGSKICYVKYTGSFEKRNYVTAELWTVNKDLKKHRYITTIKQCGAHNGASAQWVNNRVIAYNDGSGINTKAYIIDTKTKRRLWGPYDGELGHDALNDFVLYLYRGVSTGNDQVDAKIAIHELNCNTGESQEIINITELYFLNEQHNWGLDSIGWRLYHPTYSPDGKRIAFRLENKRTPDNFIIMNRDGSNIKYVGIKPLHFNWYDNESIFGHDTEVEDGMPDDNSMRLWDADMNYIKTLAGPGNHAALSPDRQYAASETWYRVNPTTLSLYESEDIEPFWSMIVSNDTYWTWERRFHVNPTFSRDSKSLYFNKVTSDGEVQAYRLKFK